MFSGFLFKLIAKLFPKKEYTDKEKAIGKRREIIAWVFLGVIALLILIAYLTMEK